VTDSEPVRSVVAEAPAAVKSPAVAAPKAVVRLELDGDEIIQLSIKPSLWFIPVVSIKWVLAAAVLGVVVAVALRGGGTREGLLTFQLLAGVAVARVAVAALQWASQLYVLTNRRVMRFRGILSVNVVGCPLTRISAADLRILGYERWLRLGSVQMTPVTPELPAVVWDHLAHPAEIHERLLRAIRKAQSGS
jgi:type III secretory pathway component EscS